MHFPSHFSVFFFFKKKTKFNFILPIFCWPGSSVGTANDYGLHGPGIETGGREIFRTRPDRPWGPLSLMYSGYRGKATGAWCYHRPPSSAEVRMSSAIHLLSLGPWWPVIWGTLPLPLPAYLLRLLSCY
jgi:hypothetical protein